MLRIFAAGVVLLAAGAAGAGAQSSSTPPAAAAAKSTTTAQPAAGPARLLVPSAAVLRRGELTAVYVATDRGFLLRAVRLGADHAGSGVEVLAGLKVGERIALDPVKAGLAGASVATAR